MSDHPHYDEQLRALQIDLVRYQKWAMSRGEKVVIVFEGRDGAGKDGVIKRISQHLATRNTRVISLPKPSDRERGEWWFQRYVRYLPGEGEIVLYNRSWYNRAGVEPVMGFCTDVQHENFLHDAPTFERMLIEADIRIVKFWLDISKAEQAKRLDARRADPIKALKVSDLDGLAQKKWKAYSAARDSMLTRTHSADAPWTCVHTDKKTHARLAVIQHILHRLAPAEIHEKVAIPDPQVLFSFETEALTDGRLEP